MAKFIHMSLNHDNDVCRSISLSKLFCKDSTFASDYSYLSCKYNLSYDDWHLNTSHLIGKVQSKNKQKSCNIGSCQDIIELYEIRDGLALCDILSNDDVRKLIDIICLELVIPTVLYYYYCNYYCNPCKHVMYITLCTVFT